MEQIDKESYNEIFFIKIREYNEKKDYNTHCILINNIVMIIYWEKQRWQFDIYKIDEKWT
jgi:hypothetical protein